MEDFTKSPRVFVAHALSEGLSIDITDDAHHYLKNVMRVMKGDTVRLFNGRDGEFVGRIEDTAKKSLNVTIEKRLRAQKNAVRKIHLLFAPIKKERMDFLIEKAVELGATDLHIVLTQNTDIRKINQDRIATQIIEAAEQCERLDIPALHAPQDLFVKMAGWKKDIPILAAIERSDAKPLSKTDGDCAVLIGPSGGFDAAEKEKLAALTFINPVSLGENILRSETAAAAALSIIAL